MVDTAERGWLESDGLRRGLWIVLGAASLVTILLGILQVGTMINALAFLLVAAIVAVLSRIDWSCDTSDQVTSEAPGSSAR